MKAAAFDYFAAPDLSAAVRALAEAGGEAKALAGGQSIGPMLNLRLVRPRLIVDISRLAALRTLQPSADGVRIGAAVTHAEIEDAASRLRAAPMLATVAGGVAYRAVRNRGTIGGSLAHADPAADWPLALSTLGARVLITGPRGTRDVAADAFMTAAFTTVLSDDELIEAIDVPACSPLARWGYFKLCRKTGEFPEASAAALFDPQRRVARLFVGALNGPPQPLESLARGLAQQGLTALTQAAVDRAVGAAAPGLDAVERKIHVAAVQRAVRQALLP